MALETVKPIGVDATGYEVLTRAVLQLLNEYPGLGEREIFFEELGENSGLAFSADSGALVMTERRSITGHMKQTCQFPLFVVYRTSSPREYQALNVQDFMDKLGKWLCMEPIEINSEKIQLQQYPQLAEGREITRITRSNSYGTVPNENGVQNWLMPVTVQYTNEFDLGFVW